MKIGSRISPSYLPEMSRRQLFYTSGIVASALWAPEVSAQPTLYHDDGKLHLGCCYYPEQWDSKRWESDAREMAARGIERVRIAEFAWTLMEPEEGRYDWSWLDMAVATLAGAGLRVVLGTPTAAPPEWLVERYPDILPMGPDGKVKHFGSRRYYSFSSEIYRHHCARIAAAMAKRYGQHPAVIGWQIDNEYGCHDTTYSYGPADRAAFQIWLKVKYQSIARLNEAWGTVVWSQQISAFDKIDVPNTTPTDLPPAMLLDFRQFSSDQVVAFHKVQAAEIRKHSPGRFITHNFMARFTDFDEYALGSDIDFASWDSYPLGVAAYLDDARWDRTGHPDITGWQHDFMFAINPNPFWVMEQQPGAVNWARNNPVPLPGMVRLWAWEAFAYGASTVSHFRWRQAKVGPEQMHAGLNRPDGAISPGGKEAAQVAREVRALGPVSARGRARVALLFDFQTVWVTAIQPDGAGQNALDHAIGWYSALRRLGLDMDIVRPGASLAGYRLVVVPSVAILTASAMAALAASQGLIVVGPRTGSKTANFAIPDEIAPGPLQKLLPVKVTQVGTQRDGAAYAVSGLVAGKALRWRETLETAMPVLARYDDEGSAAIVGSDRIWYAGCQGDTAFTNSLMAQAAHKAGLPVMELPDFVRIKRRGNLCFAFNYGSTAWLAPETARDFLLGGREILPQELAIWRI